MYRHHPLTLEIDRLLAQNEVGQVDSVVGVFSVFDPEDRASTDDTRDWRQRQECGGGVPYDYTCYPINGCGHYIRDLPVRASLDVWDREETYADAPPGDRDVVISPSLPGAPKPTTLLRNEVNIIHWGEDVIDSMYDEVDVSGLIDLLDPAVSGWAKLGISSATSATGSPYQAICQWDGDYFNNPLAVPGGPSYDPNDPQTCTPTSTQPPMIGYVAWERSFPANPDGNYGRAVNHSFESGSD